MLDQIKLEAHLTTSYGVSLTFMMDGWLAESAEQLVLTTTERYLLYRERTSFMVKVTI